MSVMIAAPGSLKPLIERAFGEWSTVAEVTAEAIRTELQARGVANRRSLCLRVSDLLKPVVDAPIEEVRQRLESLEKAGDVTAGGGGFVAAAPLRAVEIGGGDFRVFGTVPSRWLEDRLGTRLRPESRGRTATVSMEGEFRAAFGGIGGLVLTPERWAGLDKKLPAGSAWLAEISADLENAGSEGGMALSVPDAEWRAYVPEESGESAGSRWKKAEIAERSRLWRTAGEVPSSYIYMWTSGGPPLGVRSLHLSGDDSLRTQFSMDMAAGCRRVFPVRREGERAIVEIAAWIPAAEYRYLAVTGVALISDDRSRRFAFSTTVWPQVATILRERLGIDFDDRSE